MSSHVHVSRHVSVSRETSRHVCHVQTLCVSFTYVNLIFDFTFANLFL